MPVKLRSYNGDKGQEKRRTQASALSPSFLLRSVVTVSLISFSVLGETPSLSGEKGAEALATPEKRVLSATVGLLEGKLVTSEDVYFSQTVEKLLQKSTPFALEGPLSLEKLQLASLISMRRHLVFLAAKNLSYQGVSQSQAKSTFLDLKKKSPKEVAEIEKRFSKGANAIEQEIYEHLVSQSFLKAKTATLTPLVTEAEERSYYEKNRLLFHSNRFEDVAKTINLYLVRKKLEDNITEWFSQLEMDYQMTLILGNPSLSIAPH